MGSSVLLCAALPSRSSSVRLQACEHKPRGDEVHATKIGGRHDPTQALGVEGIGGFCQAPTMTSEVNSICVQIIGIDDGISQHQHRGGCEHCAPECAVEFPSRYAAHLRVQLQGR